MFQQQLEYGNSQIWERIRDLARKYYHLKIKLFGLKMHYNMYNDIEIPLDNDRDYVMTTIRDEYPEYFTAIDFTSDLLDNFHPMSKNSLSFMSAHLKALNDKEDRKKIVKAFAESTRKNARIYIMHE